MFLCFADVIEMSTKLRFSKKVWQMGKKLWMFYNALTPTATSTTGSGFSWCNTNTHTGESIARSLP
jgi:hypothetical protein